MLLSTWQMCSFSSQSIGKKRSSLHLPGKNRVYLYILLSELCQLSCSCPGGLHISIPTKHHAFPLYWLPYLYYHMRWAENNYSLDNLIGQMHTRRREINCKMLCLPHSKAYRHFGISFLKWEISCRTLHHLSWRHTILRGLSGFGR